jgi:Mce-associated membrane protein
MTDETVQTAEPAPAEAPSAAGRPSKADRLEARAARLREQEERRASAPSRSGPPRWAIVTAAVIAVLLVAALAFSVVRWRQADARAAHAGRAAAQADTTASLRESALAAAQRDAVEFASYDYRTLAADFARARAHLTPQFAAKYDQISAQLRQVIVQYRGTSKATVLAAAVQSVAPTQAVVLLFVDQTITTNQSKTPRIDRNRMQLTMQREHDGSWLISNLLLK